MINFRGRYETSLFWQLCKVTHLCKVHGGLKQQRTVFKYQIIRIALALLGSIAKHFENKFTNIKSDPVTLSLDRG